MVLETAIANYPDKFKGTVISPTKICLQWEQVTSKLRVLTNEQYVPLPNGDYGFTIKNTPTLIDVLSVGSQMPLIEDIQKTLIMSYLLYGKKHSADYRTAYNKEFIDFINEISNLINLVKQELQ